MLKNLPAGLKMLSNAGLNLQAIFDTQHLPQAIQAAFATEAIPLASYKRLVLLGNAGKGLWAGLQAAGMRGKNPIDRYSQQLAERFINEFTNAAPTLQLYPHGAMIPLQQLGKLAGWHHDSPLGLGIHSEYGVWFAYRAAFLIDAALPLQQPAPTQSPCDTCADKPCMQACPAGAVREIGKFSIPQCATQRLSPNAACADRCLARLACPVAPQHLYPIEQVQYHYGQSLETIRQWYG